jgi:hypothetical protein
MWPWREPNNQRHDNNPTSTKSFFFLPSHHSFGASLLFGMNYLSCLDGHVQPFFLSLLYNIFYIKPTSFKNSLSNSNNNLNFLATGRPRCHRPTFDASIKKPSHGSFVQPMIYHAIHGFWWQNIKPVRQFIRRVVLGRNNCKHSSSWAQQLRVCWSLSFDESMTFW